MGDGFNMAWRLVFNETPETCRVLASDVHLRQRAPSSVNWKCIAPPGCLSNLMQCRSADEAE